MNPIPHPGNPGHTDNLATIELLEAQGFSGSDASLAISLFEYDLVWRKLPPDSEMDVEHRTGHLEFPEDYLFVYRISGEKDHEKQFDRQAMSSARDLAKEFNWIADGKWADLAQAYGLRVTEWHALDYPQKVCDLVHYFGWERIFGDSHWGGFLIRDPEHVYGGEPAPGESVEDYEARLLGSEGEPVIPTDFVRDEDQVWFVCGGPFSDGFGGAMCQWHDNMDAIYAVGSSVIASQPAALDVLEEAIALMRRNVMVSEQRAADVYTSEDGRKQALYGAAHAQVLLDIMEAALAASPSEEPQSYDG